MSRSGFSFCHRLSGGEGSTSACLLSETSPGASNFSVIAAVIKKRTVVVMPAIAFFSASYLQLIHRVKQKLCGQLFQPVLSAVLRSASALRPVCHGTDDFFVPARRRGDGMPDPRHTEERPSGRFRGISLASKRVTASVFHGQLDPLPVAAYRLLGAPVTTRYPYVPFYPG